MAATTTITTGNLTLNAGAGGAGGNIQIDFSQMQNSIKDIQTTLKDSLNTTKQNENFLNGIAKTAVVSSTLFLGIKALDLRIQHPPEVHTKFDQFMEEHTFIAGTINVIAESPIACSVGVLACYVLSRL